MPTIHRTSQSIELPHETVRLPLSFFHVLFVYLSRHGNLRRIVEDALAQDATKDDLELARQAFKAMVTNNSCAEIVEEAMESESMASYIKGAEDALAQFGRNKGWTGRP